jgi:hypothetical protein
MIVGPDENVIISAGKPISPSEARKRTIVRLGEFSAEGHVSFGSQWRRNVAHNKSGATPAK